MRRINHLLKRDRGAAAVMVGILLVPLVGCLAIALDVGALYVERSQLQNGADAAALAIAQECAEDGVCDAPSALAESFSNDNANDDAANVLQPEFPNSHTVVVTTSTRVADTNASAISHPFAALIGISSTTVGASATAEWGSPWASSTLPLALSYCEFNAALDGTLQTIRYDQNLECKGRDGHPIPGGFAWLDRTDGVCGTMVEVDPDTGEGRVQSEAGNSYPGSCDALFADLEGQTVLVPIFDGAATKTGPAKWYDVYAFAAFTITGWKFAGGNKFPQVNVDPAAPKCPDAGNCRFIQGYFSHWVSLDSLDYELGGPNLGASIVRLID